MASGWIEKDMGGNGDCFFRAWIKAENHYFGKTQKEDEITKAALQLRVEAIKHIRKHKAHYEASWCNDTIMEEQYQRAGQNPPKNFEDFLQQASKKSFYVNEHLINAVVTRTGTPCVIWRAYSSTTKGENGKADSTKKLWHRGVFAPGFNNGQAKANSKCGGITLMLRAEHYTCVLPPTASDPPSAWLRECHESIERQWVAGVKKDAPTTPRKSSPRWGTETPTKSTPRWGLATPASSNKQTATPGSNRWGTSTPGSSSKA